MTILYHGALFFRVHLGGEELRLTWDYQLSRFFPLPAFPPPLWRVLAERVAHPTRTSSVPAPSSLPRPVRPLAALDSNTLAFQILCYIVGMPPILWSQLAPPRPQSQLCAPSSSV